MLTPTCSDYTLTNIYPIHDLLIINYLKLTQFKSEIYIYNFEQIPRWPSSLLRPLVLEPKCNFQCKLISLMRPVHYKDHYQHVPFVVLLSGLLCITFFIKSDSVN